MKKSWSWGIMFKPANEKEPSVQEHFVTRDEAIKANVANYEGKGRVVHVARYR